MHVHIIPVTLLLDVQINHKPPVLMYLIMLPRSAKVDFRRLPFTLTLNFQVTKIGVLRWNMLQIMVKKGFSYGTKLYMKQFLFIHYRALL